MAKKDIFESVKSRFAHRVRKIRYRATELKVNYCKRGAEGPLLQLNDVGNIFFATKITGKRYSRIPECAKSRLAHWVPKTVIYFAYNNFLHISDMKT